MAHSYPSGGREPGATLHRPCLPPSSCTCSPSSSERPSSQRIRTPGYTDAFYYVDAARSIAQGNGFNVDVVWIFPEVGGTIPADPTLPIPAFGHWMPLAALVQVPFLALFGPQPWASAAPFVLIGATAAPLTWAIARDAGASAVVAVGAGVLIAIPALSVAFMAQPDNFALFQPLVAGALWMTARGLKGSPRSFVLAGLLAGLATLSRTDGVLVLLVVVLAFAWDRTRGRGVIPVSAAVGAVAAFVLVMAPWWIRQLAVFGMLSPSMASGKVLFIRSIGEWDSIATPATLEHLLGMGAGPLIASRVGGFLAAVTIYVVLIAGLVLAPFIVVGGWARRRSVDFGPFFTYAVRAVRVLGAPLRRPRPGRHVHPLRRGAGAAQLRARARRRGGRRRLVRPASARLGSRSGDAAGNSGCRGRRRAWRADVRRRRPCGLGGRA